MLLFDLDGTLIDSNGLWVDVDRTFLERRGLEAAAQREELAIALRREGVELPESIYCHEQLVAAILNRGEDCLCSRI